MKRQNCRCLLAEGGWWVFSTVISTGGRRHPLGFPGYSPLRMPPEPSKDNLPEPVISCSASTKTQFSSVHSLSRVRLFATPWTAARQASLSTSNSRSLLKLMSIKSVLPPNHLILCRPLLLPSGGSFPASGSFQMSQFFASGGQSIRASASALVLPMNIQD